jgi:signal transduction histidine kinase
MNGAVHDLPAVADGAASWEHAACGLLSCTPSGQIVRINATLCRWLGCEESPPTSLADLFTAPALLFFEMQLRPLLALGRTVDGAFITLRHNDGQALPVLLNAMHRPGAHTMELALVTVREREQYEATLRQSHADAEAALDALTASAYAQKMQAVGQMAGGIAHEFNNLLAVIRGNLTFAQEGLSASVIPDTHVRSDIASALTATDRAVGIVRQLLAFTGRQVVRRSLIDVNQVVRDAAELLEHALGDGIRWQLHLSPTLWPVYAAGDQLQHVLTALVLNARDAVVASGGPGLITVATDNVPCEGTDRECVRLVVQDTGVGMNAEVRERAILPFFTTKGPGGGTGLGLSMVYGAVQALGGTMQLESVPGEGARVTLLLRRGRD